MIAALIPAVATLLDKFIPDADEKNRIANEIATLASKQAHEIALAQIEVNKEEAKSQGIFKGGWRPGLAWVCVAAFAWHFVLQPISIFLIALYGVDIPPLPQFDMDTLMTVLLGMLGLGTMRTVERIKGKIPNGK
jgi:hypothetical protein